MSSHNQPHAPKPGDSEDVGRTWLRNRTAWLNACAEPTARVTARYAGRHVNTDCGEGTILHLTGSEVLIGLMNPRVGEPPITITRGTHGWDLFVATNPGVFS